MASGDLHRQLEAVCAGLDTDVPSAQKVFTNADEYVNKTLVGWANGLRRRGEGRPADDIG